MSRIGGLLLLVRGLAVLGLVACDRDLIFGDAGVPSGADDAAGAGTDAPVNPAADASVASSRDAAKDAAASLPDAPPPGPTPDCPEGACGWKVQGCPGPDCKLDCTAHLLCTGACPAACVANCKADSVCSLQGGAGSHFKCDRGSCLFSLPEGGEVTCQNQADCAVECLGHCELNCSVDSTCRLSCGSSAARLVTGETECQ